MEKLYFGILVSALFLSGCAQKGTITLYGTESKGEVFNTYLLPKQLKECNNKVLTSANSEDFVLDRRWSNSIVHQVPTNFSSQSHENSTVSKTVNLEIDKLRDGRETVIGACLTKLGEVQLYFSSRDVKVKPLVQLENDDFTCSDEITLNAEQKFVHCKTIAK